MADAAGLQQEMFDVIASRDLARLRELYHKEYRYSGASGEEGGAEAGIEVAETYTRAFPDLSFRQVKLITSGNTSVLELVATGTHNGPLGDLAPTGRGCEVRLCNVVEERDGKIYREREYFDTLNLMQQLGAA